MKEKINFSFDIIKKEKIHLDVWTEDYLVINKIKN